MQPFFDRHIMFNRPHQSSLLMAALLLITGLLTGCQSSLMHNYSAAAVNVTPSQLSRYWVIQDRAIDWQLVANQYPNLQRIHVQFEINSQGNIVNLAIDELYKDQYAVIADLESYKFKATAENANAIPVRVNATILFNE